MGLMVFNAQDKDGDGESETSLTVLNVLANIRMATVHLYEACLLCQDDCVWQADGLLGLLR